MYSMKKQLDELLKDALTPIDEPSFWLNQNILNQVIFKEWQGDFSNHCWDSEVHIVSTIS